MWSQREKEEEKRIEENNGGDIERVAGENEERERERVNGVGLRKERRRQQRRERVKKRWMDEVEGGWGVCRRGNE